MTKIPRIMKLYFGQRIPGLWKFSRKAVKDQKYQLGKIVPPDNPFASLNLDFSRMSPKEVRGIARQAVRLEKIDMDDLRLTNKRNLIIYMRKEIENEKKSVREILTRLKLIYVDKTEPAEKTELILIHKALFLALGNASKAEKEQFQQDFKELSTTGSPEAYERIEAIISRNFGLRDLDEIEFKHLFDYVKDETGKKREFLDLPELLTGQEIAIPDWFPRPGKRFSSDWILLSLNIRSMMKRLTDKPRIYYQGIGANKNGGAFDILKPLLQYDYTDLIGTDISDLSFNKFCVLARHDLRGLRDENNGLVVNSLKCLKEGPGIYTATFDFLEKKRRVKAYFGFDGSTGFPKELEQGFNAALIVGGQVPDGLMDHFDKKAGLCIGEGATELFPTPRLESANPWHFGKLLDEWTEVNSFAFFRLSTRINHVNHTYETPSSCSRVHFSSFFVPPETEQALFASQAQVTIK
ncbi:MAG: hypothetical protein ABIH69_02220 [bacterium]